MNRKSQISDYMVRSIPKMLFLGVVIVSILFLVHLFVKTEVNTFDAESTLFVQRLLYSKNGISYTDKETGQVSPGILNVSELPLLEEKLKKSVQYGDVRHLAAKMVFLDMGGSEIATVFYNQEWYERWIVMSNFMGAGRADALQRKVYLLVKDRTSLDIWNLQKQLADMQDGWQQAQRARLEQQIEELRKGPHDSSLVPVYMEVTVVMPR